jgi:hypothetical protein
VQIFMSAACRRCPLLVKMHSQWWWLCGMIVFCSWQFALPNGVIVHPVSGVFSVEINRRHYFQSPPRTFFNLKHFHLVFLFKVGHNLNTHTCQ